MKFLDVKKPAPAGNRGGLNPRDTMSESMNRGGEKLGEITVDRDDRFVVVTNFGTFKLAIASGPISERKFKALLDVLNGRKPR